MDNCPYCGHIHAGVCPRVKAIEYEPDGVTVKRVEFHPPAAPRDYIISGPCGGHGEPPDPDAKRNHGGHGEPQDYR